MMFHLPPILWLALILVALVGPGQTVWAQTQPATVASPSEPAISPDEQQIRQNIVSFVETYNAHKADAVAALFAPDAVFITKNGTELRGHDAIRQALVSAGEENPKAAVSVNVDEIRFLSPDVAVEEGSTTFYPDGELATSDSRYTVLHVKRAGKWLMQSVRVVKEEMLSNYEYLKPLEWLIGQWIDEGRDEVIEVKWNFSEDKNFLLQEFQVIRENQVLMKGTQRLGWDPQTEQIRCWVFDSDGGFSEGIWTEVDDQWICKASGVLRDGTSASSTRILTRMDKDRVIWSSVDRLLGGEKLPDLEVTMVCASRPNRNDAGRALCRPTSLAREGL